MTTCIIIAPHENLVNISFVKQPKNRLKQLRKTIRCYLYLKVKTNIVTELTTKLNQYHVFGTWFHLNKHVKKILYRYRFDEMVKDFGYRKIRAKTKLELHKKYGGTDEQLYLAAKAHGLRLGQLFGLWRLIKIRRKKNLEKPV